MKKTKSIQADNEPGRFHRNDSFTEFYWDVPDVVNGGKSFVGRKHDDWGIDFHAIAQRINKYINHNFNQGKI